MDTLNSGEDVNQTDVVPSPQPPAQPQAPAPAPGGMPPVAPANANPGSRLHAHLFDGILRTLSGGDVNVTMPDGKVQGVPQSKSTMAKSILAGALAGMFSGGSSTSETPYGPRIDPAKAMSNGFQAGKQERQSVDQTAQRAADTIQAKKLQNFDNNARQIQQSMALWHMKHEQLDSVVNNNKSGILSAADQYDQQRAPGDPSIYLAKGLEAKDAMSVFDPKSGSHSVADSNVVLQGTKDILNPETGQYEAHPIYAILRPDVKLKLNEDQTKQLGRFFPQMDKAWDLTKGDVNIAASNYTAAMQKVNAATIAEGWLNRIAGDMGKDPIDLAAAFRDSKNKSGLMSSIMATQSALSQGGTSDSVLEQVGKSGGAELLSLLGSPDQLNDYAEGIKTERIQAEAKAKAAGLLLGGGVKSVGQAMGILSKPDSTDEEKKMASDWLVNNAEQQGSLAGTKATSAQKAKMKAVMEDPETTALANNIVKGGGFGKMNDFVSRGQGEKKALSIALSAAAEQHGLDASEFSPAALDTKATMYKDYQGGKTRQNLNSFNIFAAHANDAIDAINRIKSRGLSIRGVPVLNMPLNEWADKFSGDPDVRTLKAALLPPSKEFMSFLNNNRAEHDKDIDAMAGQVNINTSPDNLLTTFKSLMKSADDRVVGLGDAYVGTMKTTYPELVNSSTLATMKKAGVDSQAGRYATPLPKGNWQYLDPDPNNAQMQKVKEAFMTAAGGDKDRARMLAKYNGWSLDQNQNPPQAAPQQ